MLYIFFQYASERVLIHRIFFGFEAILEMYLPLAEMIDNSLQQTDTGDC